MMLDNMLYKTRRHRCRCLHVLDGLSVYLELTCCQMLNMVMGVVSFSCPAASWQFSTQSARSPLASPNWGNLAGHLMPAAICSLAEDLIAINKLHHHSLSGGGRLRSVMNLKPLNQIVSEREREREKFYKFSTRNRCCDDRTADGVVDCSNVRAAAHVWRFWRTAAFGRVIWARPPFAMQTNAPKVFSETFETFNISPH